jgi:hypothetical protein
MTPHPTHRVATVVNCPQVDKFDIARQRVRLRIVDIGVKDDSGHHHDDFLALPPMRSTIDAVVRR